MIGRVHAQPKLCVDECKWNGEWVRGRWREGRKGSLGGERRKGKEGRGEGWGEGGQENWTGVSEVLTSYKVNAWHNPSLQAWVWQCEDLFTFASYWGCLSSTCSQLGHQSSKKAERPYSVDEWVRNSVRTWVTAGERAEALGATARGFPAIGDVLGVVGNGRKALIPHYEQNRPTNASKTLSRSFTGGYLYSNRRINETRKVVFSDYSFRINKLGI